MVCKRIRPVIRLRFSTHAQLADGKQICHLAVSTGAEWRGKGGEKEGVCASSASVLPRVIDIITKQRKTQVA